jgi:hypothetical protein
LTGCKSRLGHPRFRKTGRAAPLPFLIKQATHSPYFRTSPGAGVGLGAPELSFSAGICDLAGACPLVAAPDASGIVAAGPVLVPSCWGWGAPELSYCFGVCCCADATPALTSNAMLANTTKCLLMIRPLFPGAAESVGRETTARGDAGSCGESTAVVGGSHRRWRDASALRTTHVLPPTSSERILECGRRDTASEKRPVRATSYVRVDLQSLQP